MAKISFGGGGSSSSGDGSVISPTGSVWELYNTADQVTNYEKLKVAWISNVAEIGTLFGGATSARSIQMGASPTGGAPVNTYFRVNPSAPFFTFSRGSSTTGTGFINLSDGVGAIYMVASSSTQIAVDLNPVGAQTATAGVTVLKINPTGTWGSGTRLLIDAQDNSTSKFKVFNTGTIYGSSTSSWALYNTADEVTNHERLLLSWSANVATIFTDKNGSGTLRDLQIGNLSNAYMIARGAGSTSGSILLASSTVNTAGGVGCLHTHGSSASSGISQGITLTYTLTQSGTAGYIGLNVNCVQTSTGSGIKYLASFALGGATKAYIDTSGNVVSYSTVMHTSAAALTNGAGAGAGTITNAPSAGNPTKWVPINDNGTTRYIPAW